MPKLESLKALTFSEALFKVTKLSNFNTFTSLKFFSIFIINGSTILFRKHRKIKSQKGSADVYYLR